MCGLCGKYMVCSYLFAGTSILYVTSSLNPFSNSALNFCFFPSSRSDVISSNSTPNSKQSSSNCSSVYVLPRAAKRRSLRTERVGMGALLCEYMVLVIKGLLSTEGTWQHDNVQLGRDAIWRSCEDTV